MYVSDTNFGTKTLSYISIYTITVKKNKIPCIYKKKRSHFFLAVEDNFCNLANLVQNLRKMHTELTLKQKCNYWKILIEQDKEEHVGTSGECSSSQFSTRLSRTYGASCMS